MRASPVDLIGGYYKSDSLPWACQDTVNWLPVVAEVEGTRSLKMLETPPGLKPYQQIGTGPIRGMHDCEGLRLVVSGRYLYRITNAGVGVPIGVIPGVGRVSMTHNQFETGYQVLVENGQPGGGYVYNTVDLTFARITDEGYPGSISSDYLDSFLLGVEPFGRFWFHSDLASATSYNTLDRYEAEASPDKIVGLAVSGQEVVVFGQRTTEFFMNVGAATGTFQNRNTGFDRGCASRDTIAKLDNSIFWLGDDGIVYRLNGYSAQPVSTRALDQQLSRYNLAQAFAFVWEDRGHKVYYLTFPDGQTFGYDVVTGLWHRRESFGLDRWRLTHVVEWSGKKYGGDFQTGRIFLIDWDYHLEGSQPIISERVSPVLSDNQSRLGIPSAELVFDTGQGPGTAAIPFPPQPQTPVITGDAPDAALGSPYSPYQYMSAGGTLPFSFSIKNGSLPVGMALTTGGLLGGSPASVGFYSFTVRAYDSEGMEAELSDSITVSAISLIAGIAIEGGGRSQISIDGRTWSGLSSSTQFSGSASAAIGLENGRFALGGNGQFFKYTDTAGQSWDEIPVGMVGADIYQGRLLVAHGPNSQVGKWAISTDNGSSFSIRESALGFDFDYIAINRNNPSIVLASNRRGFRVAISTDAGESFPTSNPYSASFLSDCVAVDEENMYLGGSIADVPGVIKTTDGSSFTLFKTLDANAAGERVVKIVHAKVGGVRTFLCFTLSGIVYMTRDYFVSVVKLGDSFGGSFRDACYNGYRFIVVSNSGIFSSVDPSLGFVKSDTQLSIINTVASSPHE